MEYLLREIVECKQCTSNMNQPLIDLCQKTLDGVKTDVETYGWRSKLDKDGWDTYFTEGHEQRSEY